MIKPWAKTLKEYYDRHIESTEEWKNKTRGVADPCIDCGESTVRGSGRWVDRLPADRSDEGFYVYSFRCAECGTPPVCIMCEAEPVAGMHCEQCEQCEEIRNKRGW